LVLGPDAFSVALLSKSCPLAFPASQFLGSGFIPRSWESGKARGQDLLNNSIQYD
jgi:hypothetical protein